MSLVHPNKPQQVHKKGELHPALFLAGGFALLVGVASLVHFLFSLI